MNCPARVHSSCGRYLRPVEVGTGLPVFGCKVTDKAKQDDNPEQRLRSPPNPTRTGRLVIALAARDLEEVHLQLLCVLSLVTLVDLNSVVCPLATLVGCQYLTRSLSLAALAALVA